MPAPPARQTPNGIPLPANSGQPRLTPIAGFDARPGDGNSPVVASLPMQRARGRGVVSVKMSSGRSRIDELFQEGAAKIRLPRTADKGVEAVIINTAGGLTGGDEMAWKARAGANTELTITTQACEKTYKAADGVPARVSVDLELAPGAGLAWLPQETILFDAARLERRLNVDMAADARLLLVEPVILGRQAMGESVRTGLFRDTWRIRVDGRLVHAEDTFFGEDIAGQSARRAGLDGARAFATILCLAPDMADRLPAVRQAIGGNGGASVWSVQSGVSSTVSGKLLARVCAQDGYALRKTLVPLLRLLTKGAGVPKIWSL